MTEISYDHAAVAWSLHDQMLRRLIQEHSVARVCEIGGGANPALPLDYVVQQHLDYTVLDLLADELAKAPTGYRTITADICARELNLRAKFDLVFSKMLAEHVADAELFHRNVHQLLVPGGMAFHFFPTLYALPFVVNRLLPESFSAWLQNIVAPRDRLKHRKFPAYYHWCRGPTAVQIKRLERVGYRVVLYKGFFGHGYYGKLPVVRELHEQLTTILLRYPLAEITCFAFVVLQKTSS